MKYLQRLLSMLLSLSLVILPVVPAQAALVGNAELLGSTYNADRTLLIEAPTKQALDAALKVRELKSIAGERLNDTVLELSEDPSTPRIAEALRVQGFFLR